MRATIDRFEGEFAIMETENGYISILKAKIPPQAREGDVLLVQNEEWVIDLEATRMRKEKMNSMASELWQD
jgi:hypothetical protein